ncbi:MAG: polysaccharide biosynthesis/export family protein [Thermodesulfobacteriota bacterium]|nr:polysaccharide biosynthesis/export family protein [Thermodesulfobacteriota bacterium]
MNDFLKIKKNILIAPFIVWAGLLIFSGFSNAQNNDYVIGPRDILTLIIFAGGEEQQQVDLTVSAQGTINAPFIGSVSVKGLSVRQLESTITEPLSRDYFVNPQVNIRIKEYHSLHYYISGAVKSPGMYEMSSETSLMELLAKAGGVLPERGNVAYVLRESLEKIQEGEKIEDFLLQKDPIKIDLKRLLDLGDMSYNIVLQPGDVIYIPLEKTLNLAESKIYVEGEVKRPGVYDFQVGLTAMNACIMAGGFDKFAAPNRTKIIRRNKENQEIIKINLDNVREGKIADIELKPGDRIHVPEAWL